MLAHNTQSNDSRSNDARFMHKLHLSLHARNRLAGEITYIELKSYKILLNNLYRA